MDALQILGSLLGNNATSSGQSGHILGQLLGGGQGGRSGGGLADILGNLAGGGRSGGTSGGGLADVLGSLIGGGSSSSSRGMASGGGGLADILGSLTGGSSSRSMAGGGGSGGLADVLGSLMGGSRSGSAGGGSGAGAQLLGGLVMAALQMLGQRGASTGQSAFSGLAGMVESGQASLPTMDVDQTQRQAMTFVKAMINAAKADGQIDAEERQKIISKLSDVDPQEVAFIQEEMRKPLNFDFFSEVTQDMALQVYAVSLMAITLDTDAENHYMQQLAQGLGLDPQTVNAIHAQLGLAPLYG